MTWSLTVTPEDADPELIGELLRLCRNACAAGREAQMGLMYDHTCTSQADELAGAVGVGF